jgi:hypothetical protein
MSTAIEDVEFGVEVEEFLGTRIGKYLVARAEEEIEGALEDLKRCDPEDAKAIRALQTKIYRAESIQYWLAEIIQAGYNAEREIEENRDQ